MYIANQGVLSIYANGRTTGIAADLGDGVNFTVPVFEGFSIPHAVGKNFAAGKAITNKLLELLTLEN